MPKYRKPVQNAAEEPKFFVKHYWHAGVEGAKTHKDTLVTALLIAAIAFLGVVIWGNYAKSQQVTAWGALSTSENLTELETAAAKYASTPAGPFLKMRLATRYMLASDEQKGNVQKAVDLYTSIAATTKGDIALCAEYSLGFALESQGKFDDAKKAFERTAAQAKSFFGKLVPNGGFWAERAEEAIKTQGDRKAAAAKLASAESLAQVNQVQNTLMQAAGAAGQAGVESSAAVESSGTQESRQSQEIQSGAVPAVESTQGSPSQ